jgi:hypothetical protein
MNELLELRQNSNLFKKRTISVTDNRELSIAEKGLFRSLQFHCPLGDIAPNPNHFREVPIGWVGISVFLSLVTYASLTEVMTKNDSSAWFAFLFMLAITLACIYNTWQLSKNLLIYRNVFTGVNMFVISRNTPSALEVDKFVHNLKKRIESFRSPEGANPRELAANYKQHLEYLLNEGVLLDSELQIIERRVDEKISRESIVKIVR